MGAFFRTAREMLRLSQEDVAALTSGRPWRISRAAIGAIERGRSLPSLEALLALSRVLHVDPAEVLERADLAAALPVDLSDRSLEDLREQATELFWSGDVRAALAVCDAMLERLVLDPPADGRERDRALAEIELKRAGALRRCGALLAARSAAERVIGLRSAPDEIRAEAMIVLSVIHVRMGNLPMAEILSDGALAMSGSCEATVRGRALIQRGWVLMGRGEFERGREVLLEAREVARAAGDLRHATHIEGNIGLCWLGLGRIAEARAWVRRAVDRSRKLEQRALEAQWLVEAGWVDHADGKFGEAERSAEASLRIARPLEQWLTVFRAEWLRHRNGVARGVVEPDRHRMALLRKLLLRLEEHDGEREILEFREWLEDNRRKEREAIP